MIVCSACGRSFSIVGYTQHVYSTSHIACIQVYEWNLEVEDSEDGSAQSANDKSTTFTGDLFDEWDKDEYHNKEGYQEDQGEDDNAGGMSTLVVFLFIDAHVHYTQTLKMNVLTTGPLTLIHRHNLLMLPMTKPLILQA